MSILVKDCFHWVGFHIVDRLLQEGYDVIGVHTSPSKQAAHLAMYFERHALFTLADETEVCDVHTVLNINQNTSERITRARTIVIAEQPDFNRLPTDHIVIQQPLLFGEWMPIDDQGCYYLGDYISFASTTFRKQAVYIRNFTKMITTLLEKEHLPQVIQLETNEHTASIELILDKTYHIQDNISIEKKLKDVLTHHKKFADYY